MSRLSALAGSVLAVLALILSRDAFAGGRVLFCGIQTWQPIIREAAHRFELPRAWLYAVILEESAGCATVNGRPIVSRAGAMGLMQLMPATWREYRARLRLGRNPYRARNNIFAGAAYLHELYDRYGVEGFLAAYQAGPGRYQAFIRDGRPLPRATLEYVARVRRMIESIDGRSSSIPAPVAVAASPLFVVLTSRSVNASRPSHAALDTRLFVPLTAARRSAKESRQ